MLFVFDRNQPDRSPIETAPDQLDRRFLGQLEYAKTAAGLIILREDVLGPERFDFAFREYIRRWAFKSPRPADFFRAMEDAAGADLAWFWRGWFLQTATLDQGVESIERASKNKPARVTFTSRGDMVMPLVWKVTFADGTSATHHLPVEIWFNSDRITIPVAEKNEVARIEVDPEHHLPDVNRDDNVLEAGRRRR